jgi:hypothetical protein
LVTATDLGNVLFQFYRKVVELNVARSKRIKHELPELNPELLGGDYNGIQMNGLPKGIRVEAAIRVTIAKRS